MGMGVGGLDETRLVQGQLFDQEDRQKQARLDAVADELKQRFGADSVKSHKLSWLYGLAHLS